MHFSGIAALVVFFSFGLANPPWSLETILAVMACGVGLDWLVHRLIRPPREDAQKAKETFDNCQSWDQEGQHW